MIVEKLKQQLCSDLLIEVDESSGRSIAITAFTYPNGDSVNLYFESMGSTVAISDEGTTVDFLRSQQIKLTAERRNVIRQICKGSGVEFLPPVLRKEIVYDSLGATALAMCETISRVAAVFYHTPSQLRSPLPVAMWDLLKDRVEPSRTVDRKWIDLRHDHKKAFPVDFHVNGHGPARNIFSVTSSRKGLMVTAVVHFLRSHSIDVPTLTVVDKDAGLGDLDVTRIQAASNEIRFGLIGHEAEVVAFAMGD